MTALDDVNARYQSVREVLSECITDTPWLATFISAIVVFVVIEQIGEFLHGILLSEQQRAKTSTIEFGSYLQALFHAGLTTTGSIAYLIASFLNTKDKSYDSALYRVITVFSAGYYAQLLFYEILIPQSCSFRLVMAVHHIFSGMCQAPVFILGGSMQLLSALCFQTEISNIFMQCSWFAQQFESADWYRKFGVGVLISYPVTRCCILPIAMYYTFTWCEGMGVPTNYIWVAFLGQLFVFLMSIVYSASIILNPHTILVLQAKSEKLL